MRLIYSLFWILALPLVLARLYFRGRKEPGYRRHIAERFGRYHAMAQKRPVIWVHAVSVGETRAAEPLVRQLQLHWPQHVILLTHMTPTGRATGAELFQADIAANHLIQCYLPYDVPVLTNGLLRHYAPSVCILMETEVWPNLIHTCKQALVPVALVNARLSARSLRKAERLSALIRPAAAAIQCVAAQTAADAARIAELGVPHIVVTGNSKFDVTIPEEKILYGQQLRQQWGQRPVLVCASTRDGEEELILDAFIQAGLSNLPELLLLIVPRHPQRFDLVEQMITLRGLTVQRKSTLDTNPLASTVRVVLGDTMGELISYYVSADLAFIGGSLLPLGGQNLIEACAVARPVLIGPHTFNFEAISNDAVAAGATVRVADAQQLFSEVQRLLSDDSERHKLGQRARDFAAQHRGATARTVTLLKPLIDTHAATMS